MMNRHISISRSCKKYTPSVATRPVGLLASGSRPVGRSRLSPSVTAKRQRRSRLCVSHTSVTGNTQRKSRHRSWADSTEYTTQAGARLYSVHTDISSTCLSFYIRDSRIANKALKHDTPKGIQLSTQLSPILSDIKRMRDI